MADYVRTQNPLLAASQSVSGMSDPIFETFVRLPQLRAQLALQSQRLALQQQHQQRLNQQMDAELPNIKAQTELRIQQALAERARQQNFGAQVLQRMGNTDAADRNMRLSTMAGLPDADFATEQLNSTTLGPDLEASGISSPDLDHMTQDNLAQMIRAAITSNQQRVAMGSPASAASFLRPQPATSQVIKLTPQEGAYDLQGNKVAENTNEKQPTYADPYAQAVHGKAVLDYLEQSGLDFNKVVSGGVTNRVPTPLYTATTNAIAKALDRAGQIQPRGQQPASGNISPLSSPVGGPKVGDVEDGFQYLGGDPSKPESWKKIK